MKKILIPLAIVLYSSTVFAWSPWTAWYSSIEQAKSSAISQCKEHYGYDCVIQECQKRYQNYVNEWRCAAKKYQKPSYTPPQKPYGGY